MGIFRKKVHNEKDPVEAKFDAMMALIKDLPRTDYNRLKDAMDLGWNAYNKIRNVQTIDEKATEEISASEKTLELLEGE